MKNNLFLRSSQSFYYLLPLLFLFTFAGCETEEMVAPNTSDLTSESLTAKKATSEKLKTFYGPAQHVGNGVARAFVEMNRDGTPETIGVRISEKGLEKLPGADPAGHGPTYTLRIPNQTAGLPFDHIDLNYNPQGHPAPGIYTFEHFDFHFYMISVAQKMQLTDRTTALLVPAESLWPDGYYPDPEFVPMMGLHWADPTGTEFTNPGSFTKTFIYGSYDAEFIFYEPMITVAHLESKVSSTNPFPPLKEFGEAAYYPTSYSIDFDAQRKEYVISLGDMVWRD